MGGDANTTESRVYGAEGASGEVADRLTRLYSQFRSNVVDAVQAWSKRVADESELAGITAWAKSAARARARAANVDGFCLGIDVPSYRDVMRSADARELRRELYEAFVTRASDRGPLAGRFDNGPLIDEILALRHDQARRQGFRNYAECVLQTKVGASADTLERSLLERSAKVRPRALAELEQVWALAKARDAVKGFRPWDLPYYVERVQQQATGAHEGDLRQPRVPFGDALNALEDIESALFDLRVHRDYVPHASQLRSHVLDTLAQIRREVSLLPPPPWERMASAFLAGFGCGSVAGGGPTHSGRPAHPVLQGSSLPA